MVNMGREFGAEDPPGAKDMKNRRSRTMSPESALTAACPGLTAFASARSWPPNRRCQVNTSEG